MIPLQSPRKLVLQANFQDESEYEDTLGLAKLVNEQFREISSRGRTSPLVFVDAAELPDAYRLAGRYEVEDDKVKVKLKLIAGDDRKPLTVEGKKSDLLQLATDIAEETKRLLSDA